MRKAKIRKPKERKRKIYRPNAKVEFYKCVINSRDPGDDGRMVSSVFFYFTHDGQRHDLSADVKLSIGAGPEEGAFEVGPPAGYEGPFNQKAFSNEAANYLRLIISPSRTNNLNSERYAITFPVGMIVEFDVEGTEPGL